MLNGDANALCFSGQILLFNQLYALNTGESNQVNYYFSSETECSCECNSKGSYCKVQV